MSDSKVTANLIDFVEQILSFLVCNSASIE